MKKTNAVLLEDYINENLAPTQGLFFGSDEVDKWYYTTLQDTVDKLTELGVASSDTDDYYIYNADW